MNNREIFLVDTETGRDTSTLIATIQKAEAVDVAKVINAPLDDDGRSEWVWVRLQNGDLMLAVFPHGDTYIEVSESWK